MAGKGDVVNVHGRTSDAPNANKSASGPGRNLLER